MIQFPKLNSLHIGYLHNIYIYIPSEEPNKANKKESELLVHLLWNNRVSQNFEHLIVLTHVLQTQTLVPVPFCFLLWLLPSFLLILFIHWNSREQVNHITFTTFKQVNFYTFGQILVGNKPSLPSPLHHFLFFYKVF